MIVIRPCAGLEEYDACVALESETWGFDQTELIPRKTFLLAQKIGGQVIGAFETPGDRKRDGDGTKEQQHQDSAAKLLGFAMSLPGIRQVEGQARPYLHSHMLAVREECQNRGIGAQLKRHQRLEALQRGIRHMEWTFDPLQIKNGFLNIHRLGGIAQRYEADFYGVSSSRLQGGLPTDRLVAEWELDSPRVQAHVEGRPLALAAIEERIVVPAFIAKRKADDKDREAALSVQMNNRRKFQEAFSRGLAVIDFSLDRNGNGIYELGILPQAQQVQTSKVSS